MRWAALMTLGALIAAAGCGDDDPSASDCEQASDFYFFPGCGATGLEVVEGCHQPCFVEDDPDCPDGTSCQPAAIDPCVCNEGEDCCSACSALVLLCLPGGPGDGPFLLTNVTEPCEGGVRGQDIIDAVDDSYLTELTYADRGPAATDLTMTFRYAGGTLKCSPAVGAQAPFLDVEMDFTANSADGTFNETGTATVFANMVDTSVSFIARFDATSLMGSFSPTLRDVTEPTVTFSGDVLDATNVGSVTEGGIAIDRTESLPIGSFTTR